MTNRSSTIQYADKCKKNNTNQNVVFKYYDIIIIIRLFKWSEMTKHLRRDDANPSEEANPQTVYRINQILT